MLRKRKTKTVGVPCNWCGETAEYWIGKPIYRYCCQDEFKKCPGYQLIQKHKETCPLPESYHHDHFISKSKCYQLLYEFYSLRKGGHKGYNLRNIKKRANIQLGREKCEYCGGVGKYYISNKACCQQYAKDCPGFHDHLSKIHIQKYKDDPTIAERMSATLKVSQNRPEVKEAKSKAMKRLHNEICPECDLFRTRYIKNVGRKPKTDA